MGILSSGSYAFPSLIEKNKGLDYHKRWVQAITSRCIDENYVTSYAVLSECYRFFQEGTSGELTSHLQKAEDQTELPAPWLTLNTLATKVDLLLGELDERGYEIKVRALNKEAISRKLEEKEKLRVQRRLEPLRQTVEVPGMPLENPEQYIPQTEAELDEYFDLTFKDKAEIIMETALKYLAKRNNWDEERKALFRDIIIAGRAFIKNEIVRGVPRTRRIDPLCFVHDPNCKTDTLEDATYFGELEYLPLPAAAERYNLSEEELEQAYNSYQNYLGLGAKVDQVVNQDVSFANDFACNGGRLRYFREIDGRLNVLVFRGCWLDYKDYTYKQDVDKYGTEHLQQITEKVRKRDESKIKTKKFQVWRQCTLVGGLVVREWGECPNQARDLSDLEKTEPPYKAWIPNFAIGRGVSMVERLAPLQLMKDIAMYNMNHALTTSRGGKALVYDLAMVPEGWRPEDVMKHLSVFKIAFVNSKEMQTAPNSNINLFKEIDLSLSESINQYMLIMQFYEQEMARMSGVSPERQGIAPAASQSATATQAVILGSNLVTAPLFKGFERFCSRVLNHQSKLVKVVFPKSPEVFAPIIGESGVDFLREHIELDLDEFGAEVESLPPALQDRQKLDQMLMLAVQSDPELLDDVVPIMLERDTSVALRRFQRVRRLRKIFMAQQQQMQAEQEQALQQRLAALDVQKQQMLIEGDLQNTTLKNQGSLERTLATGRVKLGSDKIKAISELNNNRYEKVNKEGR